MSLSYAEAIAGKRPDGTQGIAVVDFQGSDGSLKELVGCAIHLSPSDKSLRNILKIEKIHKKVKYFIFLPWFNSCRPTSLSEIMSISVKFHRYETPKWKKEFNMELDTNFFTKYENDNYIVIPCKEKNFTKSSFLKKWSSKLLLHNNSNQILSAERYFIGFKKEGNGPTSNHETSLFKFCEFNVKQRTSGTGYDAHGEDSNNLEEQGVLIPGEKKLKGSIIGCYKKEGGQVKLFCFLLKGLAEISTEEEAERSQDIDTQGQPAETGEERRDNNAPGQPTATGEDRRNNNAQGQPTATGEDRRHNDTQGQPPSDQHRLASDSVDGINDSPRSTLDNPQEEWSGQVRSQETSQESEDGVRGSSQLAAPRHLNVSRNSEDESEKRKNKELVHKTFGPKVEDMPHDVKHEVGLMLNFKQSISGKDYRAVASRVDLNYYQINNLSRENPMEEVFVTMISQVKTVNNFVDILNEIKRGDVVHKMYEMALHKSVHS